MTGEWRERETGTHQDHVIAHVIGATVLAHFMADHALHLLLDIGFIWTIYVDCEMGLLPESLALRELNVADEARAELTEELRLIYGEPTEVETLARFTRAPVGCLIEEVRWLAQNELLKLEIHGETAGLIVVTAPGAGTLQIEPRQISK